MSGKIISIQSGINTFYVIKERGIIMVDGGSPNAAGKFLNSMQKSSINPKEMVLIILTHGDFDHVGSAKDIQDLTGAKIAIHEKDRMILEQGLFNWPEGVNAWGKISHYLFKPLLKRLITLKAIKADIILDNHELSLNKYGINGRVIHTPGHTSGSVSVLLDSGEAFVGCLAHNRLPFTLYPSLPIYAENMDLIKQSWKKIIDGGAETVYPGHGKPFPVKLIKKYIY